ncbi:hypothetical protein [Nostoc sp.]|uniref:hypothetical protein n=1 Tax=Nostoc sp. TaxID=1180 RepID=UPI002FF69717
MRYIAAYMCGENEPVKCQVTSSEESSYTFSPGDKCRIVPIYPTSEDQKYFGLIGTFTGLRHSPGKVYIEFEGREFAGINIYNMVAPQYCSVKPLLGIIDNDISRVSAYFLSLTEQYWVAPSLFGSAPRSR